MNSLIGRKSELDRLKEMFGQPQTRLVTLTGTGGIGKTRLALEAGSQLLEEFKDGVFFVGLGGLYDQPQIISAIEQALGLKEEADRTPFEGLKIYLQNRQLLLILDNFEQAKQGATLTEELLAASKGLKMLVTGRTNLNTPTEKVFQVHPLATPDQGHITSLKELEEYASIILFNERARLVRPDFKITSQNGPALARICWRLSGLPLALELAAARIKTLSPEALLTRLNRGFEVLTGALVDRPAHQKTLQATLEWSYNLLTPAEQDFFAKLGIFGGSWTLAAAQTILQVRPAAQSEKEQSENKPVQAGEAGISEAGAVSEPDTVKKLLSSLVSQSMLYQVSNQLGGDRYEMLEIIREFACKRLALTGLEDSILERHATYYLALAEQIAPHLMGPEQGYWYRQLDLEFSNMRMALSRLIERANSTGTAPATVAALRMPLALWRFWHFRGHLKEGLDCLETALSLSRKNLAQADFSESVTRLITGLQYRLRVAMAVFALEMGKYGFARELLAESLTWHRNQDNRLEVAAVLKTMGGMEASQGNYTQATSWYQESLQLQQELGDQRGIAVVLCALAATRQASGDLEEAKKLYRQAMPMVEVVGDRQVLAQLLNNYGELLRAGGELDSARHYFERSLNINQEINDIHGIARSHISLGEMLLEEGRYEQASDLIRQALFKLNRIGDKRYIAVCMEAFAAATRQNDARLAARLLGATAALRKDIGAPLEPGERPRYDALVAEIKESLGGEDFAAHHAEGYDLPLENSLNLILSLDVVVR